MDEPVVVERDPAMQDLLEEYLRDLLLEADEFEALKVVYRGEPNVVPARLFPFAVVYMASTTEAMGSEGYGPSTGQRFWRHEGYVAFEVLERDTESLVPDEERKANVASYMSAKDLCQAAVGLLKRWDPDEDPVDLVEGKERSTGEVWFDRIENAMTVRPNETVANRSSVLFHVYSQEDLF